MSRRTLFSGTGETSRLMMTTDWSKTPLGPVEQWPPSLIHYVNMILELPSPAIIFWGDALTQIYNDGYATIMGPRHPEYFGRAYSECWPDTYPLIHPRMRKVLDHGETVSVEKEHIPTTRFGFTEEAYFSFSFSPLRDDEGNVRGILQPVFDVTDSVLGERRGALLRALAPRADSFEPLEDSMRVLRENRTDIPFALVYLKGNQDGSLRLAAHTLDERQLPEAELAAEAREVFERGEPRQLDQLDRLLTNLPSGPWPEPPQAAVALPLRRSDASAGRGAVIFGVNPRLRLDDQYRNFLEVAAVQLLSAIDSRHALREAQQRADTIAELDRAKTEFFSSISHEFRTPLTLMLGPVEDLLAGVHGEVFGTKRAQLAMVHRNALRMQKLVNALLDFSRIQAGRMEVSREPVDLALITRDLASTFRSAIESAGLWLNVDCESLSAPVSVDTDLWEKIVLNLLSNAFKYTHKGGIDLRLREHGEVIELRVTDTGIGIPEHELPRLFERFHRVAGARGRTLEGSGIGLALVQELVRLHDGSIEVESEVDQGTTFVVTLPRGNTGNSVANAAGPSGMHHAFVEEALRWLPDAPGQMGWTGNREGAPAFRPTAAGRILVADDNADMRAYIRRLLEPYWTVETAEDGLKALAAARARRPDLILLDMMMPGLDGTALLEKLHRDASMRDVPIVILSARSGQDARVEGLEAGADDYLTKPFAARELLARVNAQLELTRLRRALEAERANLERVFAQAPVAIAVWRGPDYVYEYANPFYERMFNRGPLAGRRVREVFPERHLEKDGVWNMFDHVYETGETYTNNRYRVRMALTGCTSEEFSFTLAPLRDEKGVVIGLVSILLEVSDRYTEPA